MSDNIPKATIVRDEHTGKAKPANDLDKLRNDVRELVERIEERKKPTFSSDQRVSIIITGLVCLTVLAFLWILVHR